MIYCNMCHHMSGSHDQPDNFNNHYAPRQDYYCHTCDAWCERPQFVSLDRLKDETDDLSQAGTSRAYREWIGSPNEPSDVLPMPDVVTVRFMTDDVVQVALSVPLPHGTILSHMELTVNDLPLLSIPFSLHDGGRYHTICHREDEEIEVVKL